MSEAERRSIAAMIEDPGRGRLQPEPMTWCSACFDEYPSTESHGCWKRQATQADMARLEAKLDALILALKAGAIGQWGNDAR